MGETVDERVQRVLIGIGLSAVGLFTLLSLVPLGWLGLGRGSLFPSGNVVGPFGALLSGLLVESLGIAAALVPFLPFVWAGASFGVLTRSVSLRLSVLLVTLIALLPPLLASVAVPGGGASVRVAGDLGLWTAARSSAALGWLGSALLLSAALASAVLGTLGLRPVRALARGASMLGLTGSAVARSGSAFQRRFDSLMSRVNDARFWLAERVAPRPVRPDADSDIDVPASAGGNGSAPRAGQRTRRVSGAPELADPGDPDVSELPPLELLTPPPAEDYAVDEDALDELGDVLIEKLRTFRVNGEIGGRTTGPVVTQFEVVPASGVKVGKIAALADDLALALKAPSVRIIAPIPGKGAVGVEVPNPERKTVYLREILESPAYRSSRAQLPLALGEDVTGGPYVADLTRMPHLLIAGVTGSGKSVCINAIIASLIYRYTPERLRLLLIDPKMVELAGYSVLPHLRHPVVTDNSDAATVLRWLVFEMERRYEWLSANGCRNVPEFNQRVTRDSAIRAPDSEGGEEVAEPDLLPYIVLVIDELADLMMTVQSEVEKPLAFLAQKARATGIHLVVATQRPSVNVITGLIKANFPCRIAFRVASKVDSRTIIDQNGADTLLSNGDMLFLPPGASEPVRIQGAFVSTDDTERLIEWYRARAEDVAALEDEADILEAVRELEQEEAAKDRAEEVLEDRDELFRQAAEVVIQHDQGSTSLLQRRLRIGYGRAARIVDQLHHAGIVGPPEGSKPREVLVTLDDLERICAVPDD